MGVEAAFPAPMSVGILVPEEEMQDHEKIEPTAEALDPRPDAANDDLAPGSGGGIEAALRKAEAIAREYQDGWLRAKADALHVSMATLPVGSYT